MEILKIVYSGIFLSVGAITLGVSLKFLLSQEFFSYHAEAAGLKWNEVSKPLQTVILAIMKMAGLGTLCLSITVILYSILIFSNNSVLKYIIPPVSLLFWSGTGGVTFAVYKKTKANTPWKGSLFCVVLIIVAIIISSI
jgi:hypothetical protein